MGNKTNTYSAEFKLKAVKMYLEENRGPKFIARALGIPNRKQVEKWVKVYKTRGPEGLEEQRGKSCGPKKGRPKKLGVEDELLKLKAENEYLKKLLILEGWDLPKNPDLR